MYLNLEGFRMVLSWSNRGVYLRLQYWRGVEWLGRGRGGVKCGRFLVFVNEDLAVRLL